MNFSLLSSFSQFWGVSILGMKKIGLFHGIKSVFRTPFFSRLDLKSRKSMWTYDIWKTLFRIFLKTIKMDLRLFRFSVWWTYDSLDPGSDGLTNSFILRSRYTYYLMVNFFRALYQPCKRYLSFFWTFGPLRKLTTIFWVSVYEDICW